MEWEPIGDHHKTGNPTLAILDEKRPNRMVFVTWGMILGERRWCDVDNLHHYPPKRFTHACIIPAFTPSPPGPTQTTK